MSNKRVFLLVITLVLVAALVVPVLPSVSAQEVEI